MILPSVSCLCPTYGRVHTLREAVHSFLMQDYKGAKELVILNDFSDQEIVFDHPEVKVVNYGQRIKPLGKKFNETASLASGDVYLVWEDDDIYLPHRISYSVENMKKGLFHTGKGYFEESKYKIIRSQNLFHANLALHKGIFWSINGYSMVDWCGIDTILFDDLSRRYGQFTCDIPDSDVFYIYRWSTTGYHASFWSGHNASALAEDYVCNGVREGKVPVGKIHLNPSWDYDYRRFLPQ
jgi:glycosyltransferase involved in cell wall biosynthesis